MKIKEIGPREGARPLRSPGIRQCIAQAVFFLELIREP